MNKYVGPVLGLSGLLWGLTSATQPPAAMGGWPASWPYTLAGYALALVGVVLWRRQPHPLWAEAIPLDTEASQVLADGQPLTRCVAALQLLQVRLPDLSMADILTELEAIHTRWILPLSRTHQPFTEGVEREEGMARLALFSQGELWVNRARSAAGDQHRAETQRSLVLALGSLVAVQQVLEGRQQSLA
ncbi:MAG: hypothetical protein HQL87_14265 [Magnetococcales bacterium]|nr:hypothetical protein [Magnetococcales bacterium]